MIFIIAMESWFTLVLLFYKYEDMETQKKWKHSSSNILPSGEVVIIVRGDSKYLRFMLYMASWIKPPLHFLYIILKHMHGIL